MKKLAEALLLLLNLSFVWAGPLAAEPSKISHLRCGQGTTNFAGVYQNLLSKTAVVPVALIPQQFPDPDFINVIRSLLGVPDLEQVGSDTTVQFVVSTVNDCFEDYINHIYKIYELGTNPFIIKWLNMAYHTPIQNLDKKFILIFSKKRAIEGFSWSSYSNITYLTLPLLTGDDIKKKESQLERQLTQELLHEFYIQRDVLQNIGNGFAVNDGIDLENKLKLSSEQIELLSHICSRTALANFRALEFEKQKLASSPSASQLNGASWSCPQIVAQFNPRPLAHFFEALLPRLAMVDFVQKAKKRSDPTINRLMDEIDFLDHLYYDQHQLSPEDYALKRKKLDWRITDLNNRYQNYFVQKHQSQSLQCQEIADQLQKTGLSKEVCEQLKTPTLSKDLSSAYLMTLGPRCAACATGSLQPSSQSAEGN